MAEPQSFLSQNHHSSHSSQQQLISLRKENRKKGHGQSLNQLGYLLKSSSIKICSIESTHEPPPNKTIQGANYWNYYDNTTRKGKSNLFGEIGENPNFQNSAGRSRMESCERNLKYFQGSSGNFQRSKQILFEFTRGTNIQNEILQQAVRDILSDIEGLESELRVLKKQSEKQGKMMELGLIANKQKDSFFKNMIEQNITFKTQIEGLKLQKLQQAKEKLIKELKQNEFTNASSPINNHKLKNNSQLTQTAPVFSAQTSLQVLQPQQQFQFTPTSITSQQTINLINQNDNMTNSQSLGSINQYQNHSRQQNQFNHKQSIEDNCMISDMNSNAFSTFRKKKNFQQQNNLQIQINSQPAQSSNALPSPQIASSKHIRFPSKQLSRQMVSPSVEINEKKNQRPLFMQDSTDNVFYQSALDLDVSKILLFFIKPQSPYFQDDTEIKEFYFEGKYIKFLKGYFSDEVNMRKLIFNLEGQTLKQMFESVNSVLSHLQISMNLILKVKQVLSSVHKLFRKMNISEVFDALSVEMSKIFACDKASIFLIDEKSRIFWTKGYKNNELQKISIEQSGFCSHVVNSGQSINVLDAHLDDRFDKSIDEKNSYKTKSVLCAPIIDSTQKRVMGVLQVVNKNDGQFFTKDEEGILKVFALLSENILKNSVFNDERAEFYNSLRFLYEYSIDAIKVLTLPELFEVSVLFLQRSLNIQQFRIFLFDSKEQNFYTYEDKNRIDFTTREGIAGSVFKSQKIKVNLKVTSDQDFNNLIDIDTPLPLITIPIFKQTEQKQSQDGINSTDSSSIGVLQLVNSRGIHSLILQKDKDSKALPTNYDTLQRFCLLFSAVVFKFIQ